MFCLGIYNRFLDYAPQPMQQTYAMPTPPMQANFAPSNPYFNSPPQTQLGNVFAQPIVQDMALQYGQQVCTYFCHRMYGVINIFVFSWQTQEKPLSNKV